MQSSTHRLASSGAGRGRLLLYAALFLLVFGGLLAIAAFYDLRLDAFLLMLAAREVILLRGQNVRTLLGRKTRKARPNQPQKETAAKS